MTVEEFKELLLKDCDECTKIGGNGDVGRQMIHAYGAIEATRKLVCSEEIQEGFKFLMLKNRVDLTMEDKVLKHPELFDKETIECAKLRINNWKELQKLPKMKK